MKVVVVGVGALGCLLGAYLSGIEDVVLLGNWPEQINTIRRNGLWLTHPDGRRSHHAVAIADYRQPVTPVDIALIAVKSRQTVAAAHLAQKVLSDGGLVVTLQNGLDNLSKLRAVLGKNRVAIGVTSQGASLVGPGEVRHAGHGPTYFGRDPVLADGPRGWLTRVSDLFNAAGLEAEIVNDTEGLIWGKLAVNAAINPLTALLRVPNGFLAEDDRLIELMSLAANEVAAIARAMGITLPYPDAAERAIGVARATATNHSSMLQDILRGAPTEIDAICGAVSRAGRDVGVPTPVNSRLTQLVKQVEAGVLLMEQAGDIDKLIQLMDLEKRRAKDENSTHDR
jgi:2-dehydropantoate 2-reductase